MSKNHHSTLKLTIWMGVFYNGDHEQILPQYKVFPNPVNSAIHIQFEKVSTGTFKLYNQLGVEVMSSSIHQNNECAIPTQYLDEGLYFLTWIDDTKIKHKAQKILINH